MDVEWFTKTIIPGVKDGLKQLGQNNLPPIVLRSHDSNPQLVMEAARPLYPNLYTMGKYNGEALTTYTPRGPWAAMHQDMSRLAAAHIDNVHILANLEPFRYGATSFIQKSVQAMHNIHGANGLHLYPESAYWDWPYTADKASPRLLQTARDWLWYEAWARYAWNCHRDRSKEDQYWSTRLDSIFGTGAGKHILEAYEQSGEIAPKLLRRFGITNGNRQTLTLGMLMSQLINPSRWRVWPDLYNSDGPEGETLTEYAVKEWKRETHTGETPVQIIQEVTRHGDLAVAAIERAAGSVQDAGDEFARIRNDMYCYQALAHHFAAKVQAALLVLRYQYSHDIHDLEKALPWLEQSLHHFRELERLTRNTYLYANSMQTQQRKVPVSGADGKNKTWTELLPFYEAELRHFKAHLASLRHGNNKGTGSPQVLSPATVTLLHPVPGYYQPQTGSRVYADEPLKITSLVPALRQLRGIQLSRQQQLEKGTTLRFRSETPVKVVVGFFQSKDPAYLKAPDLETDASADNHGQSAVRLTNAIQLHGQPSVNIHTYYFPAGQHTLVLGKGACLILGFMDGQQQEEGTTSGTLEQLFN